MNRPIRLLISGIDEFRAGNLDAHVDLDVDNEFGRVAEAFNKMTTTLVEREQALEYLASHDELTGLYNTREFRTILKRELQRSGRHHHKCCVVLLDVDRFKAINDTYGHLVGDKVLRQIGLSIRTLLRQSDIGARYGGEEFVLILPEMNLETGCLVAERTRKDIAGWDVCADSGERVRVTVSAGVAVYPDDGMEMSALLSRADQRLYEAKELGRNCVVPAVDNENYAEVV